MNDRIKQIIEYYGLSVRAFEQKISVSESLIYRGLARNSDFGASVIAKILNYCSDISPDWLLLGKGEMLREKRENVGGEGRGYVKIPADVWGSMQIWTESLKRKDDQISQLIEMLKGNNGNSEGAGQGKKDRHAEEAGGRL